MTAGDDTQAEVAGLSITLSSHLGRRGNVACIQVEGHCKEIK